MVSDLVEGRTGQGCNVNGYQPFEWVTHSYCLLGGRPILPDPSTPNLTF